jgi:hypothetical protein
MKSGISATICWRRRASARGIMKQMNVKMVGTTDDPIRWNIARCRKTPPSYQSAAKLAPG